MTECVDLSNMNVISHLMFFWIATLPLVARNDVKGEFMGITSLRGRSVSDVAIQYLVIAGLPAITLNVFFETAHLGRLKFFDL
jgi:hypothetical protein